MGDTHIAALGLIVATAAVIWVLTWMYYRGELADQRSYSARLEHQIRAHEQTARAQDQVIKAAESQGFIASDHTPGRHEGGDHD